MSNSLNQNIVSENALYIPDYDPSQSTVGVVHVGYGAFHRAHQAFYFDSFMEKSKDLSWGIAAINLRVEDRSAFEETQLSDGYILKTVAPDGAYSNRWMRCHREFLDWSKDSKSAEDLIAKPSVKVITITVTESGYYLDSDGSLNLTDPLIKTELSGESNRTIYTYLTGALKTRAAENTGPITVMCCDNIRANGHMLEANFKLFLQKSDNVDLLNWVEENVSFPSSMVDRITPKINPELSVENAAQYQLENSQTVLGEDFIQWVVEDNFAGPKPGLSDVGVEFTSNVQAYEEIKIRILNGGHTCLAYLGALSGFHSFDELMRDPALVAHFDLYEQNEVLPALAQDLPINTKEYLKTIRSRFSNAFIADTVERICTDGFAKFSIFIRPTLEGTFARGAVPTYGLRSAASWYVFARHSAAGKLKITYFEPNSELLNPLIADDGLEKFIHSELLWGQLPQTYPAFATTLRQEIQNMEQTWPV